MFGIFPVNLRRKIVQNRYIIVFREQFARDVGADEACASGDEYMWHICVI